MNKLIIVFILLMFLTGTLLAEMRTDKEKQTICEQFISARSIDKSIENEYELTTERELLANVYTLSDEGFIVVSADDRIFPIIAYSWHGSYDPNINFNDLQFRFLAEELKLRRNYLNDHPEIANMNLQKWNDLLTGNSRPGNNFLQWPPDGTTNTGGWCKTQWNQSGVYNEMCPLDASGNRSVVGCTATAMAQIMYFHEYAGNPVFNSSDNYYSGWSDPIHIDADHETHDFPDWSELNEYLDDVALHFNDGEELTNTDLAALNYACGVSVEMIYSSEGSGAWVSDVASALTGKFDYDSATWDENWGNSFYTNVAEDMKQMKPCEFSICTEGWNDGHAIVCDGYNTDDYYHLNFGWGTSNIGWYYLPEGMPSNYTIINGATRNIEGGIHPVSVNGVVNGPSDLEGCYIFLEGEDYSFEAYAETDGEFSFDAVLPGWYYVTAVINRVWYYEEELYIDAGSNELSIDLFNYEGLTGNVSADISTQGTLIAIYEDGVLLNTTVSDENGDFAIPDILPGNYDITATLHPDYFGSNSVVIDPSNQYAEIVMEAYDENYTIDFAGEPVEEYTIVPLQISCGIKITADDMPEDTGSLIAGISFICPINSDEGSITAQLWREEQLIAEQEIIEFSYADEISCLFPQFESLNEDHEYFVGYSIYSETGSIAWHDNGPRVDGKGAWFRINGWVELNGSYDYNFCISADIIGGEVINQINPENIASASKITSCYPNPFYSKINRNNAEISFYIENSAEVKLDCYNLKGQIVSHIFNGYKTAGSYFANWQPGTLSSGIYFYRLILDDNVYDTQKIIIIK